MKKKFEDNVMAIGKMLVKRHLSKDWKIEWGSSSRDPKSSTPMMYAVAGQCHNLEKKIYLNIDGVRDNKQYSLWVETVLHEIAHAKISVKFSGHGFVWKRMARKLGIPPVSFTREEEHREMERSVK